MNDLTAEERMIVLWRDGDRCLACGRRPPTLQHRKAKGMGGRGDKALALNCADAVALCNDCNVNAEGSMQREAKRYGWKIGRNCSVPGTEVPYFDRMTGLWWLPDAWGARRRVDGAWAVNQIELALAS